MQRGEVLEVGRDGSFDVSDVSERVQEIDLQLSETLREKGNAAFQAKSFEQAIDYYTKAIEKNPHNHLLFSNRAAAHLQLKHYDAALDDANATVTLAPKWIKGFARKAAAHEALHQWPEALECYKNTVKLETQESPESKRAKAKIEQIEQRVHNAKGQDAVQRGFFHQPKVKGRSSIYSEKEDIVKQVVDRESGATRLEHDDERRWRYMLTRLKAGCNKLGVNANGEKVVLDDGVFAKLLQEREFQALIYPGIPKEQLSHAPKSLQELLEDPWYEEELVALMPKVQAKAHSVLTNVKKRGAAQGEIMDAATESVLMPQVLQEAFGREVLAMVHRINYKKHVLLANDARTIADPNADEATWDQLPDEMLEELFSKVPLRTDNVAGTAILDEFMGDEWVSLIQNDAQRMIKGGLLMATTNPTEVAISGRPAGGTGGKIRFLERADCTQQYPALAELIEKLHALPFEINAKRPANATLCAQFAHCTALVRLSHGEEQRLRLDCGTGEKDNGFKLTCVYFIKGCPTVTLRLRTQLEADARVQCVDCCADRLVVFQSQRVLNEIPVLEGEDDELVYVVFWIHGRELK